MKTVCCFSHGDFFFFRSSGYSTLHRAEEIPIMCRLNLPTVIFLLLFLLFLLFLLLLLPSNPPVLHSDYNTALFHDPPYSSHKHSYAQANHAVDRSLNSMLRFHICRRFVKGVY